VEKLIKIHLRQKNGEYVEKMFDFVPLSKRHEYLKKERSLEARKKAIQDSLLAGQNSTI